jgi:two-component system, LytTR family, sensor histidine kinase AgrC
MTLLELNILTLFDPIMLLLIFYGTLKEQKPKIRPSILYVILYVLSNFLIKSLITQPILSHVIATMVLFTLFYFYCKVVSGNDFVSVFTIFAFIHLTGILVQTFSAIILSMVIENLERNFFNALLGQSISIGMILALFKWAKLSRLEIYFQRKSVPFRGVAINLYLIYYGLTLLWFIDTKYYTEKIIPIMILILFVILINMIFFRESILNKSYTEKIGVFETYLPIIDKLVDEIKEKQHDYDNHIQTLIALKTNIPSDLSSTINNYIEEATDNHILKDLMQLNNKIVMALFYSKYVEAKEKGIDLEFTITNSMFRSEYTDYELVEMYGILLDNAIEATQKTDKKETRVFLGKKDGKNIFEVINPSKNVSTKELRNFFEKGYTTKTEKGHGFGFSKLKKLTEKKNGTIICDYDTDSSEVIFEITHV